MEGPSALARFDPAAFSDAKFDAVEFVNSCFSPTGNQSTVLTELRRDLQSHEETLQRGLVDLLNREYDGFLGLSSNLDGTTETIDTIGASVGAFRERINGVFVHVDGALEEFESKVQEKQQTAARQQFLDILSDAQEAAQEVRRLLDEYDALHHKAEEDTDDFRQFLEKGALPQSEEETLKSEAVLCERLSRKWTYLKALTTKGARFELVQQMAPRMDALQKELREKLERTFLTSLRLGSSEECQTCLRVFAFTDDVEAAESIVRLRIVRPEVEKRISQEVVRQASLASDQGQSLKRMYDGVLHFVEEKLSLLLRCPCAPFEFHFLANAVWREVEQALGTRGAILFAPGIPETFHASYTQSMAFFRSLEGFCTDAASLTALRCHPSTISFRKKWNLDVYFQLRLRQAAGALESALALPPHTGNTQGEAQSLLPHVGAAQGGEGDEFRLEATRVLWQCVQVCWSDGVWVDALAQKFLRLILQLFSRYTAWLDAGLGVGTESDEKGKSSVSTWSQSQLPLPEMLLVYVDATNLKRRIGTELPELIVGRFGAVGASPEAPEAGQLRAAVKQCLKDVATSLGRLLPAIRESVATVISRKCFVVLQAVPRIKSTFLAKTKTPTTHSGYVSSVLEPLREALLDNSTNAALLASLTKSGTDMGKMATLVVDKVTKRYVGLLQELLDIVLKTEESLKRLHKNKGGGGDSNKIRLQLALDTQEYIRELRTFEFDSEAAVQTLESLGLSDSIS